MYKTLAVAALTSGATSFTKVPIRKRELQEEMIASQLDKLADRMNANEVDDSNADVSLKDFSDAQYYLDLHVGTPGQKIEAAIDTMGSDTWVESSSCHSTHCWFKKDYKHKKSKTYKSDGQSFKIYFGENKVQGHVSQDIIDVGGVQAEMKFGEITKVRHRMFKDKKATGVLGLGYDALSVDGLQSFMDLAQVDDRSFSIYLHQDEDKSYFVVPGMDTANWGVIDTHNVAEEKYWALNVDYVKQSTGKPILAYKNKIVLDSSTSLIAGPEAIMNPLMSGIDIKKDCSNFESLPDLVFSIDGIEYSVPASSYVLKEKKNKKKSKCSSKVQTHNLIDGDYIVLGDPFLRHYPAHFNLATNTIQFMKPNAGFDW
mmetsp:Transcript_34718/g.53277  ORF Transcript_34718/g.53277 Transcript_34718/m.53277 type:complete len:371 (-) Transcript_34718:66-1178(-)|eukprot:CAMPEP_0170478610 /NCGR_PEP_ID=MMETSP0208-20121228/79_1 /TAXON_ID=197538 /ORGANISM="Strombidium inclinatum, Strain S3" /LENGTH=370 /DNA_ID=CAMNT_0010750901 /DNA_START=24 /DNA_END=1133 /DNA_ORIENTATION=-